MFVRLRNRIGDYVGIDPTLKNSSQSEHCTLIRGYFPEDLPSDIGDFDSITVLAVFEHIKPHAQKEFALHCDRLLRPGGFLIITIPSAVVDPILDILKRIRFIHGMALEEHYGFEIKHTPAIFSVGDLQVVEIKRFQLGLNNLFVFHKSVRPC